MILPSLQRALRRKAKPTPEEQEFIVSMQSIVQRLRDEGRMEGRMEGEVLGGRRLLRRVLAARQLVPNRAEAARIDACDDFSTTERWIEQAMTAQSVGEALRRAGTGRAARRPAIARVPRQRKNTTPA